MLEEGLRGFIWILVRLVSSKGSFSDFKDGEESRYGGEVGWRIFWRGRVEERREVVVG